MLHDELTPYLIKIKYNYEVKIESNLINFYSSLLNLNFLLKCSEVHKKENPVHEVSANADLRKDQTILGLLHVVLPCIGSEVHNILILFFLL